MFAVIKTGGKQYRVEPGTELDIERIDGEAGDTLEFPEVLLVNNGKDVQVGRPLLDGASVKAEILAQTKGDKVIIFKKIRRQGKQLKKGHRQQLTRVRVSDISA